MLTNRAIEMLGSPLTRYRGFRLRVTCGSETCRHMGEVRIEMGHHMVSEWLLGAEE